MRKVCEESIATVIGAAAISAVMGMATARAQDDPTFPVREAQNYAESYGRSIDQTTNPVYVTLRSADAQTYVGQQLFGERGLEYVGDPLRRIEVWDRRRGTVLGIAYENRYGATIRGHLWAPFLPFVDPVTGEATSGPLPAVVLINGFGSPTMLYRAFAQGLAEEGYLVMQFDPQGSARRTAASICLQDPYCCDVEWNSLCVEHVQGICGQSCVPCSHDKCVEGTPLDPRCDPCVERICLLDPYCCATAWDSLCVEHVQGICGQSCD